jgi:hypothetical protein
MFGGGINLPKLTIITDTRFKMHFYNLENTIKSATGSLYS